MSQLDELYQKAILEQKNYLSQIQDAFNKHCEQMMQEAVAKLKLMPEGSPMRQQIFDEYKKQVAESLGQLRTESDNSTNRSRRKLEEIYRQLEEEQLQMLEAYMKKISTK